MNERGTQELFAGILRLVPFSGVQFRDAKIERALAIRTRCQFLDETFDIDGAPRRILMPLEVPEEVASPSANARRVRHPVTGLTVDPAAVHDVGALDAAIAFAGRWIPIPYLRFVGRDAAGRPQFDAGPSNWVRIFLSLDSDTAAPLRLTIAFDTTLVQQSRLDVETYAAPTADDAAFGSTFFFSSELDDIAPLIGEPWFEAWLTASFQPPASADDAGRFEHIHLAAYLTLLQLIASSHVLPEARFTDTVQRRFPQQTAVVDLVLDIGDAETTALLVDVGQGDGSPASGYAELLRLRDLSDPALVHEGSFPTAVEFDGTPFGDAGLSRASGRVDAFRWPSLARIGREAHRLSLRTTGTEGVTGLSNLRAFLLDDNASPGLWRLSTDETEAGRMGPMVSGTVLGFVGETGSVIGVGPVDPAQLLLSDLRPAIRPRFSRASMLGFFAAEVLLHALAQANEPGRDGGGAADADVRELRQVVVLAPPTLTEPERQALAARIEQGVAMVWRGFDWDLPADGVPARPPVRLGLGGDMGLQIAFLHNEVATKYQGRFGDMMRIYRRGDINGDALRIGSIDFGARTTTLAVVDYAIADTAVAGDEWLPTMRVQERLPVGTDSVAQSLIWSLVLPSVEKSLTAAGLTPARQFLDEITGRSNTSLLIDDPYFTRRLNRKIFWPAGQGLLQVAEDGARSLAHGNRAITLATLVDLGGGRFEGVAHAFETAALRAGARGFTLGRVSIDLDRGVLDKIVRSEMQAIVQQVARSVSKATCDLLLLGGKGVRLSAVAEEMLALLPLPAGRIIDLDTYENTSAADVLSHSPRITGATMLPAIASALDLRQQLEASGLGALAQRRLGPAAAAPKAIASYAREDAGQLVAAEPSSGRALAYPSKGG